MYSFLPNQRVSLLLNAPHPDKIALTNGVNKSEFVHFQILRTFLVKFQKLIKSTGYWLSIRL